MGMPLVRLGLRKQSHTVGLPTRQDAEHNERLGVWRERKSHAPLPDPQSPFALVSPETPDVTSPVVAKRVTLRRIRVCRRRSRRLRPRSAAGVHSTCRFMPKSLPDVCVPEGFSACKLLAGLLNGCLFFWGF